MGSPISRPSSTSKYISARHPDACFYLTTRGDRREPIFDDDEDRANLLAVLAHALARFDAMCFAWCLMGNHYHFVIQTLAANLSRLMRHVNGVYTQQYNRRHGKVGHLFQGRFKAVLVDEDGYFLEVCRYVDLNPVRAGLVRRPQDWPWSSYRAHAGLAAGPGWLASDELHRRLAPRAPRRDGPARYARFVSEGRGVKLWDEALSGQIYLGDAAFVARMQARAARGAGRGEQREVPKPQRRTARPLASYLAGGDRNAAIAHAHLDGHHTQTSIARATGLSISRVSRIIAAFEARRNAAR